MIGDPIWFFAKYVASLNTENVSEEFKNTLCRSHMALLCLMNEMCLTLFIPKM